MQPGVIGLSRTSGHIVRCPVRDGHRHMALDGGAAASEALAGDHVEPRAGK
jgi:hypothetical protein